MSKRNYKELWEQLKVVVLCGGKKRWSSKDIQGTMTSLEIFQLNQGPLDVMAPSLIKSTEEEKK